MIEYHPLSRSEEYNGDERTRSERVLSSLKYSLRFRRGDRVRDFVFRNVIETIEAAATEYESYTNYHYSGADTLDTGGSCSRWTQSFSSEGEYWQEIRLGSVAQKGSYYRTPVIALRRYMNEYEPNGPAYFYSLRLFGRSMNDRKRAFKKYLKNRKIRRQFKRMTGEELPF